MSQTHTCTLKQCVHAFAPDRGFQNGGSTISFKRHFRHINHIIKADRRIASNILMLILILVLIPTETLIW